LQEDSVVLKVASMKQHITPYLKTRNGSSVEGYKRHHLIHHYKFGSKEDPTLLYYKDVKITDLAGSSMRYFLWIVLIKPSIGFSAWWVLRYTYTLFLMAPFTILPIALFWISLLIVITAIGALKLFILYYLVPLLLVYPILIHLSEVSDHAGLYQYSKKRLMNTRSNLGSVLQQFFIHPHHDGYHLIHHLRPGIPAHLLRNAHEDCLKVSGYRDTAIQSQGLWNTIQQIKALETMHTT
jgi:fatty acid desaturase